MIEMGHVIKTQVMKARFFELLCKDMESQHVRALLWLSKWKVSSCMNEHKKESCSFKNEKYDKFCEYLKKKNHGCLK